MPAKAKAPATMQEDAAPGLFTLRRAQRTFWMSPHPVQYIIARRRYGKSRLLGGKGIQRMIRIRNHSVFYINASLRQGVENIRAQVKAWTEVMSMARELAARHNMLLTTSADDVPDPLSARPGDSNHGRGRKMLSEDDICQQYFDALTSVENTGGLNAKKMESRIYHTGSIYSRSMVVPANPDTAVGYGGDTFKDEYARWQNWREVEEALGPLIDENPHLISWGATTPPPDDDAHPSWHFLNPGDQEFPVNPDGNWYWSNAEDEDAERFPILRVDAHDAQEEAPLFARTAGRPVITVAEARRRATDKRAFDRNYLLKFFTGGAAALSADVIAAAMHSNPGLAIEMGALTDLIEEGEA